MEFIYLVSMFIHIHVNFYCSRLQDEILWSNEIIFLKLSWKDFLLFGLWIDGKQISFGLE